MTAEEAKKYLDEMQELGLVGTTENYEDNSHMVISEGKVLWMDQSENYQRRSGPEVVLAALQKHLD